MNKPLVIGGLVVIAVLILVKRDLEIVSTSIVLFSTTGQSSIQKNDSSPVLVSGHLDALNNQTYTWYGNQWMPPKGVPLYTRDDMMQAFSQFDTLWIGDSTTRRAYATIFALVNSTTPMVSVSTIDGHRVINVNKRYYAGKVDEYSCFTERDNAKQFVQPGMMVDMWTNAS